MKTPAGVLQSVSRVSSHAASCPLREYGADNPTSMNAAHESECSDLTKLV